MNKDSNQKAMLCKHFYSLGWFAQPEVVVFHKGGVYEQKKVITDIDVLALRPSTNFSWEIVLGDCKTLKGQSPANRALWLKGLMDFYPASEGLLVLKKELNIEIDHKLFASSFGVTILNENEFSEYDKAIVYPDGSQDFPVSLNDILALRSISERYPRLRSLTDYLYTLSWNESSFIDLIRKLLGEAQQISPEIDPTKKDHRALILDACAIFSIGLAECVGIIFKQYLKPEYQNVLDESLKFLIWGGRSQYDFVAKLRNDLIAAKKAQPSPLTLPEWDRFMQLVRTMLEFPALVFSVPVLLRRASIDVFLGHTFLNKFSSENDLLLLKFGMLVCSYFCRAAKLPPQTREIIENEFIKKQTDILEMHKKNSIDFQTSENQHGLVEKSLEKTSLLTISPDQLDNVQINNREAMNSQPSLPLEKEDDTDDLLGT